MFFLQIIGKLLKTLRAGPSPSQVAAGFTMGMFLGVLPFFNLYSIFIIFLIFILNVNISGAMLGWIVFKMFAFILDPVFHDIGYNLLAENQSLSGIWTTLYNLPLFPLTNYNNTVVFGGLICAVTLALPVFLLFKQFVILYRNTIEPKVSKMKLVQAFRSSSVYNFYAKIQNLRN